tara:strand:+ start:241 stop:648 length:408 start_codon:yes stop_codon:yes gene_type:complete
MKYLSEYMEGKQTKLFKDNNVFFAFGDRQLKEGLKKHKIKDSNLVCSLGAGMVCPKENAKTVVESLHRIYTDSVKEDLKENGKEAVILRELENHECFYTGSIDDAIEKLEDYPITKEEIRKVYCKNYNRIVKLYG